MSEHAVVESEHGHAVTVCTDQEGHVLLGFHSHNRALLECWEGFLYFTPASVLRIASAIYGAAAEAGQVAVEAEKPNKRRQTERAGSRAGDTAHAVAGEQAALL